MLNTVTGGWVNLLRVRKVGRPEPAPPPGAGRTATSSGASWRYLEHDWVAREGATSSSRRARSTPWSSTRGVEEMITFFHISGAMIYVDEHGASDRLRGRAHEDRDVPVALRGVGLGEDFVEQFIR